jgi:Glucosamine 6-phosphate synthetase, contains amidotransferase and phosphosugar isomerase domains
MTLGPLAQKEEGRPAVLWAPRDEEVKKTTSNTQEGIARGAKVLLRTNKSKDEIAHENTRQPIKVENTNDDWSPGGITVPWQKLAYHTALNKG